MGDFKTALEMIKIAATFCRVDVVKFQKRNNKELLSKVEYKKEHPVPENSYGKTYGEHREFLEFNISQHSELQKECLRLGVKYSTSVWDLTSAKEIVGIKPELIKIPSATNTNFRVLKYLNGFWNLFLIFNLLPTSFSNIIYRFIAKNRYNWFGKHDICPLPEKKYAHKFL